MRRMTLLRAVLFLAVFTTATARAGRFEALTAWAAKGPKMQVKTATFWGGAGNEGFADVVQAPDGGLIVVGNAYGPQAFPAQGEVVQIGAGAHSGKDAMPADDRGIGAFLDKHGPDAAGFMVFFDPKLTGAKRVVRFGWGVASVRAAEMSKDGKALLLFGACQAAPLAEALRGAAVQTDRLEGGRNPAPFPPCLMRYDLARNRIEWCRIFDGYAAASDRVWQDNAGRVYLPLNGLVRVAADGSGSTRITTKYDGRGAAGIRGVDPADGTYFCGGDRNTHTGHQPWRQPFLYKMNDQGERLWKLWEWDPKTCACGGNGNGLCSDSSIRSMEVAPNGDLVMIGWSDGGNSVFGRQPTDLSKAAPMQGMFSGWGARSAISYSYILRLDGTTHEQKAATLWLAYVPDNFAAARNRGAPNTVSIEQMETLDRGCVALTGGSATGLISTPNAFYVHGPASTNKYGGKYASVLNSAFSEMLFSSYLPGYYVSSLRRTAAGVVVVGAAARDNGRPPRDPQFAAMPSINALQREFGGGKMDGHLVLLEFPPGYVGTPAVAAATAHTITSRQPTQ